MTCVWVFALKQLVVLLTERNRMVGLSYAQGPSVVSALVTAGAGAIHEPVSRVHMAATAASQLSGKYYPCLDSTPVFSFDGFSIL